MCEYSLRIHCVEILKYNVSGVSFTEVRLSYSYHHLFESGMARDEMILKTVARVLILVVHLCLGGTYKSKLGNVFLPRCTLHYAVVVWPPISLCCLFFYHSPRIQADAVARQTTQKLETAA